MRAIIFTNGMMTHWPAGLKLYPDQDVIIAADGGMHHCLEWGFTPHIVVGDMDSVDPVVLVGLEKNGVEIIRHPARKDETDLELALKVALGRDCLQIVILGALGARWDMTLSNVLILVAPYLSDANVRILDGHQEFFCCRAGQKIEPHGRQGDVISILPLTGTAEGVTLHGLEFPLDNATLPPGTTWGMSNIFTNRTAAIEVKKGCLLVAITHLDRDITKKANIRR